MMSFSFSRVRRVVVTGGAGFIGSHLAEALLASGCRVQVVDDLSGGSVQNLPMGHDRLQLLKVDLARPEADRPALFQAIAEADLVFHLASPVGVFRAHRQRLQVCQSILGSSLTVIEACRQGQTPLLVTSSSEVYGTGSTAPLKESDLAPLSVDARWGYGVSKLAMEHLALGLIEESGIPAWVVRFFNVAGPRQRAETGLCVATFVRAALEGAPLVVHGSGTQKRAFLHVADAVEAVLAVVQSGNLIGVPVNIGGDAPVTIRQVAEETVRLVNPAAPIEFRQPRELLGAAFQEVPERVPDLSLIHARTSWRSRRTMDEIIIGNARTSRTAPRCGEAAPPAISGEAAPPAISGAAATPALG